MSADVNTSANNQYNLPPDTTTQYDQNANSTTTGGVSGVQGPPGQQTGQVGQLHQDFLEQSQSQSQANNPEAANPKIQQPEIQQAILSNSDALKFMLMNNMMNVFVTQNNNTNDRVSIQFNSSSSNFDEAMLHQMSNMGYDLSVPQSLEMMFNKTVNDIINDSWDKFNAVIQDFKQRDAEWMKSGAKAYLDLINSSQYQSQEWDKKNPQEKMIVNPSAAQFEVFLNNVSTQDRQDFIASNSATGEAAGNLNKYLMSNNLEAFGNAYKDNTVGEYNANNPQTITSTSMVNAGSIMSHPPSADNVSTDRANFNLINDSLAASNNPNAVPMVGVDSNTIATLGYLGAMMASSAMLVSSFHSVAAEKSQGKHGQDAKDVDFANRYSKNVSDFVNSKGFEEGVNAVITQRMGKDAQVSPEQKSEVVNRLRVMMLSDAFVLLNVARNSSMTGETWRAAVENPESLNNAKDPIIGETAYALARDINTYLPKDPVQKENLLSSLQSFYNTSPSKDELLETNTSLKTAFYDYDSGNVATAA